MEKIKLTVKGVSRGKKGEKKGETVKELTEQKD